MDERMVILNELTQGIRPLPQGVGWFEGLADTEQFETAAVTSSPAPVRRSS
ncbi:hypothetical protein ACIF8T_25940 [Streptomyces sp. NPDC085946]|uniref:hypothetical protein n=1 Tax=Streptomyces sp. NPDC085946 TaxID=3365744 RepID=UPI0037D53958